MTGGTEAAARFLACLHSTFHALSRLSVDFTERFSNIDVYRLALGLRIAMYWSESSEPKPLRSQAVEPPSERNSKTASDKSSSRRWLLFAGLAILGISGFVGWQQWRIRIDLAEQAKLEAASVPRVPTVTALGRLEPQDELIQLSAPSAAQGARVEELLVTAGDRVQQNQVIAVLDSRDRLQAALQKAEENVQIARAKLAQVKAGAKSGEIQAQIAEIARLEAAQIADIEAQRSTIARLDAEVKNAQADFERYDYLFRQGAISGSERDARQLSYTTAQRSLEEAQVGLSRIQSTGQQQINQARSTLARIQEVRPVDISSAETEVNAAIADVATAQAELAQTEVRSPISSQVIEVHARPGEDIGSEGIVTLGQTDQMRVVAEVYQSDIGKIQPGQSVEVTTPVLSETLQGTVERIGLQVGQQQVVSDDPAANLDARVVDVYISLNAESSERVSGLSNLQVTATIETESALSGSIQLEK